MVRSDEELAAAWEAYHGGDLSAAEMTCVRLLAADPDHAGALFLAGLIDYQCQRPRQAIARLTRLLQSRPNYAEAHNNLGNAFAADGQLGNAEKAFRLALRYKPRYAEALNNLGNSLRDQRRLDEAIDAYARALEIQSDYAECHNNLGIALARKKQYGQAAQSYRRACDLNPTFAEPHNNLGIVLAMQGQAAEAVESFRRALVLKPTYVDAWANLGVQLLDLGEIDEAISAYQGAVDISPKAARLQNGLGAALARRGRLEEAVAAFRRALSLDRDCAQAHNNLGNGLRELGELDKAEDHLRRAISLESDYADAHNNLGVLLVKRRRIDQALAAYQRALQLKPNYAEAHLNRAVAWLAAGDFRRGWVEYEWRWRAPGYHELACPQPRWDGGLLDGKTILLWAEQGLGDTFQFVRYARLVRDRAGYVLLRAPGRLHALLSRTPGVDGLVAEEESLPRFDCHAPLLSLPRLFATTLDEIPADVPYLFPDERLVERWRANLDRAGGDLKVGVAWQGDPRFHADQRSLPLENWLPFADIPGVRLVNLQKGPSAEQLEVLPHQTKVAVFPAEDLGAAAGAFADTAAVIANLDLVVTSDTPIAHLAGAMGVPVWLVLAHAADWRWLLEGEGSPWYPSMRLFRQTSSGDWAEVFARARKTLSEALADRLPCRSLTRDPATAQCMMLMAHKHAQQLPLFNSRSSYSAGLECTRRRTCGTRRVDRSDRAFSPRAEIPARLRGCSQ